MLHFAYKISKIIRIRPLNNLIRVPFCSFVGILEIFCKRQDKDFKIFNENFLNNLKKLIFKF